MTNEELRQIRERAEKATAGPWNTAYTTDDVFVLDEADIVLCASGRKEDAEFIAHAREDIPKLLAEIDWLKCLVEEYKQANDTLHRDYIKYLTKYSELYRSVAKSAISHVLNEEAIENE